jgi:hypothetical protein
MSAIVAFGLTPEQFRANEAHRVAWKAFLDTPTGAEILYIARNYARPSKVSGFPEDKLSELRAVAHSRSEGMYDLLDMLLLLVNAPSQHGEAVTTKKLGSPSEDDLPPAFPKPVLKTTTHE